MKAPPWLQNAPELFLGLEFTYSTYFRLSSCRQWNMGCPGPIPWQAIDDFCRRNGLGEDDQSDLEFYLAKMDEVYIKHMNDKAAKKQEFNRSQAETQRKSLSTKLREKNGF